jgi:hypothetical protein
MFPFLLRWNGGEEEEKKKNPSKKVKPFAGV